jgi:hypothetical protein
MAHKAYTFRYRVRNWRTYNQALIARGGISFWIDEAGYTPTPPFNVPLW